MGRTCEVSLTVNGVSYRQPVEARRLLSDFLRHELALKGTRVGCEQGVCGSCTVLVNGEPARSCLMLAVQADGQEIETVEGLSSGTSGETGGKTSGGTDGETGGEPGLAGLPAAMRDEHGLQCGFCTPGILMSLTAAERDGMGAEEAIERVLPGHLCRCTGYGGIRAAIRCHWSRRADLASSAGLR